MIYTVTLNPSVDRTLRIEALNAGRLHRVLERTDNAGGKGINVARALVRLGASCIAIGFLGGASGKWIRRTLEVEGVGGEWIEIQGETRMNIKIWAEKTKETTELNEAGPSPLPDEWEKLRNLLRMLPMTNDGKDKGRRDIIVFAGNPPVGSPTGVYAELITIAKERGMYTVLDTNGDYLAAGITAKPDLIKPNMDELGALVSKDCSRPELVAAAAKELVGSGISAVVVSMGAEGAVYCNEVETILAQAPTVDTKSTVGCGDALVAGTVYALQQGLSWDEIARFGVASGSAAATTSGTEPGERSLIERLADYVIVSKLEPDCC